MPSACTLIIFSNQMEEEEEEKEEEEEEEGEEPVSKKRKRKRRKRVRWCKIRRDPTVHADGDTSQGGGGEGGGEEEEDDGNLSDLDNDELDEYILTEKEVSIPGTHIHPARQVKTSAVEPPSQDIC